MKQQKVNKWKVAFILTALVFFALMLNYAYQHQILNFGNVQITRQDFNNLAKAIEKDGGDRFGLCDITKDKCLFVQNVGGKG